ncbi:hypothetical protein BV20DRAFT_1056111 [Pilatotrama ljubarskyi]|nr:hypothetical protein BV20DRAFT_1056111 [Pilatotrama ljubarskyi]
MDADAVITVSSRECSPVAGAGASRDAQSQPAPRRSARPRPKPRPLKRPVQFEDIIELTSSSDSDSDSLPANISQLLFASQEKHSQGSGSGAPARKSGQAAAKGKGKGKARAGAAAEPLQPVAGPSRRRDDTPSSAAAPVPAPAPAPAAAVPAAAQRARSSKPARAEEGREQELPLFLEDDFDLDFRLPEDMFIGNPAAMLVDEPPAPPPSAVPAPAPAPIPLPGPAPVPAPVPAANVDANANDPPAARAPAQNVQDAQNAQNAGGDPFDGYAAQILEIIPDVAPAHVYALLELHHAAYGDKVVEPVLHHLFEDPDYPRAGARAGEKRKRDEGDEGGGEEGREQRKEAGRAVRPKIDYGDKNRKWEGGQLYHLLALERLVSDFPDIPIPHIRETYHKNNSLYAPTFLALRTQRTLQPLPYKPITRPRPQPKAKGKAVAKHDEELEREVQWIQEKLDEEAALKAAEEAEERRVQEEGGIECGCCFTEYPFDKMVQCPEAHLFCVSCMLSYAETKLGAHDAKLVCMDQSGCTLPFSDSEIRRFLSSSPSQAKLLELWERVKQRKEIEAAGLEGLEECPFCDYKVVIENDVERLFRCENQACGAVTCRKCKKPDHLPKSCEEVAEDKKLDIRHAIEEAMTRALMRNCPKCQKAFVKEMGCNKMRCPDCGSLSCYVCRKLITGYEHFGNPPPYTGEADPNKCPLWDTSVEGRHSDEVTAAAKQAIEEYKRAHPEIDEKDLAVDLPPPPPPPPAGPSRAAHVHGIPPLPAHMPHVHVERLADFVAAPGPANPALVNVRAHMAAMEQRRRAMRAQRAAIDEERRVAQLERRDMVRAWQQQHQAVVAARAGMEAALHAAFQPQFQPAANAAQAAPAQAQAHVNANPHAHAPVYNVEVHINHNQPPAAAVHHPLPQAVFFQPPPYVPPNFNVAQPRAPAPGVPAAAPVVAQRRSKRVQGRRAK